MTRALTMPLNVFSTNEMAACSRSCGDREAFSTGFARIEAMQHQAMSHAFRSHGGFIGSDDVTQELRRVCDQPISRLARWIVSRSIVSISWRAQTLMPAFQFDRADMSIRPCVSDVLLELGPVFDNWEMALWFATPNAWLDHAAPVTLLADDALSVLQAARTDRFVAFG